MIGRLQLRSDFTRLAEGGTYVRSGGLWCRMMLDPTRSHAHVGYAIGRSFGGAVARNRIRRRLRILLAGHAERLRPGLYLVGAQPSLDGSSAQALAQSVDDLITQISKRYE